MQNLAETNGQYRFALQELMRIKVQLLTLNGKVNDAIKYGNEALLPFIEHTMVV